MSKPRFEDLYLKTDEYEQFDHVVPCFRRKSTGEVFFVPDDENVALDKFVQVQDIDGAVVNVRRRDIGERLMGKLRRVVMTVIGGLPLGLPANLATGILRAVAGRSAKAKAVLDAFTRADKGDLPGAVEGLLRSLSPREWTQALEGFEKNLERIKREVFERAVILNVTPPPP